MEETNWRPLFRAHSQNFDIPVREIQVQSFHITVRIHSEISRMTSETWESLLLAPQAMNLPNRLI